MGKHSAQQTNTMTPKNLTVCKANQVIEASYRLTLNEQRVVLACIAQVNSKEALLVTDKFELSAQDFSGFFSVSEDRAYSELQSIAKSLYQRSVTIHNPDPKRPKLQKIETRWLSSIGYIPEEGKITLCFAQDMLPYLSELKGQFTRYKLENVGNMTSIYAIRLYELMMQWKSTGSREVEIAWLKKQFQIEDLYADMHNFKQRVLLPAINDINTHSDYQVAWSQRKTGRNVTHLNFIFTEKQPTTAPSASESKILGVRKSVIEKQAKVGESWEQAAQRIKAKQHQVK